MSPTRDRVLRTLSAILPGQSLRGGETYFLERSGMCVVIGPAISPLEDESLTLTVSTGLPPDSDAIRGISFWMLVNLADCTWALKCLGRTDRSGSLTFSGVAGGAVYMLAAALPRGKHQNGLRLKLAEERVSFGLVTPKQDRVLAAHRTDRQGVGVLPVDSEADSCIVRIVRKPKEWIDDRVLLLLEPIRPCTPSQWASAVGNLDSRAQVAYAVEEIANYDPDRFTRVLGVGANLYGRGERTAASAIAERLVKGTCRCFEDFQRFDVTSREEARRHCSERHSLAAWERSRIPLQRFVFQALLQGPPAREHLRALTAALDLSSHSRENIIAALARRTQEIARSALRRIAEEVFSLRGRSSTEWADAEGESAASLTAQAVYEGNFRCLEPIETPDVQAEARRTYWQANCSLAAWDPFTDLDEWLFRVVVGGPLRTTYAFRKGLLASCILSPRGEMLVAGRILRCKVCRAEVTAGRCDCAGDPQAWPAPWIFQKGSRIQKSLRRCRSCGLYVSGRRCPDCGEITRSRPCTLWVRPEPPPVIPTEMTRDEDVEVLAGAREALEHLTKSVKADLSRKESLVLAMSIRGMNHKEIAVELRMTEESARTCEGRARAILLAHVFRSEPELVGGRESIAKAFRETCEAGELTSAERAAFEKVALGGSRRKTRAFFSSCSKVARRLPRFW